MRTRLSAIHGICVLVLLLAPVIGCTRVGELDDEAPEVQIAVSVDPDPPVFGRACQIVVTLLAADGMPIDAAQLEIRGDMTHAGMVPVVVTVSEGSAGAYRTGFDWTMAGDWILFVKADLPDGRVARRQFEIRVGVPDG